MPTNCCNVRTFCGSAKAAAASGIGNVGWMASRKKQRAEVLNVIEWKDPCLPRCLGFTLTTKHIHVSMCYTNNSMRRKEDSQPASQPVKSESLRCRDC